MAKILEVDLLAFENGDAAQRRAVIDGTSRSLASGFVLVKSDLSEDLIDEAYGMLEEFYSYSTADKMRFYVPGANGQTGYTGIGVESAAGEATKDFKEMSNFSTPLPPGHPLYKKYPSAYPAEQVLPEELVPGITEVMFTFHNAQAELQRRFLHVIAEGLGAHESYFDSMVHLGPTLTRSIHYPAMAEAPEDGKEHIWAGQHQDVNLTTILPRATKKGLQVLLNGEWEDVVAPPGYVILNKGLYLDRISNGRMPGGLHRVVADPNEKGDRYSMVQFLHCRPSTILTPLPSCVDEANPIKYAPISAGDLLEDVLFNIGLTSTETLTS